MNLVSHCFDTSWDDAHLIPQSLAQLEMAYLGSFPYHRCRGRERIATGRVMPDDIRYELVTKLTEIMMDYIKSKQRIEAIEPLIEYFKPKIVSDINIEGLIKEVINTFWDAPISDISAWKKTVPSDPIEKEKVQDEKHIKVEYEKQDEKLITPDDIPKVKPDVTKNRIIDLQNAMDKESGGSLSMDVLCYDGAGKLGLVGKVNQILYVMEKISEDYFVCRILETM